MWDKKWEQIHQRQDWGKYPPEELVRFVAKNYYKVKDRSKVRFLDLGCGLGAGAWYLAREGFGVWGVDGSNTVIDKVCKRFVDENLHGFFEVNDYLKASFTKNSFDCVIDLCSIQHNKPEDQQIAVNNIYKWLTPGGKVFSMMYEIESNRSTTYVYYNKQADLESLFKKFVNLKVVWLYREDEDGYEGIYVITAEKPKRKR